MYVIQCSILPLTCSLINTRRQHERDARGIPAANAGCRNHLPAGRHALHSAQAAPRKGAPIPLLLSFHPPGRGALRSPLRCVPFTGIPHPRGQAGHIEFRIRWQWPLHLSARHALRWGVAAADCRGPQQNAKAEKRHDSQCEQVVAVLELVARRAAAGGAGGRGGVVGRNVGCGWGGR